MKRFQVVALLAMIVLITAGTQAAFIVEPHSSGKAFANFTGTPPRYSSAVSAAIGLTATNSAYGSTVVLVVFSESDTGAVYRYFWPAPVLCSR